MSTEKKIEFTEKQEEERWSDLDYLLKRKGPFAQEGFITEGDFTSKIFLHEYCKVLIIGAGGLGCDLLKNLAMSGFKDIHIIDMDTIDVSNLNRQFLFRDKDVGKSKAETAANFINERVPGVKVTPFVGRIEDKDDDFYRQFNIIIAGLDSIKARSWINKKLCDLVEFQDEEQTIVDMTTVKPLIDGGTEGFKGQARIIWPRINSCFECTMNLFPQDQNFAMCTIASTPRLPEHCICAGTLVSLANGTSKTIENIQVGDTVITCNEETKNLELKKVTKVMDNGLKECIELILLDGTSLICTEDHRILVYNSETKKTIWKEAKDIDSSDLVLKGNVPIHRTFDVKEKVNILTEDMILDLGHRKSFPTSLPISSDDIQRCTSLMRLLGICLTDGCLYTKGNSTGGYISVGQKDDVFEIKKDLEVLGFNDISYSLCQTFMNKNGSTMKTFRIELPSPLPTCLKALGGCVDKKVSQEQIFPKWILESSDYVIYEFLNGMLSGDGHIPEISYTRIERSIGFSRSSEYKFRDSLNSFMDNVISLFKKVGYQEPTKQFRLYAKYEDKNKYFTISLDDLNLSETEIKNKFKVEDDPIIMIQALIFLSIENLSKFEKEMTFIYCNEKKKSFRERMSFFNMKKYLLKRKNDLYSEVYTLHKDEGKKQSESFELVQQKYNDYKYFETFLTTHRSVFETFQKNGTVAKQLYPLPFLWKIPSYTEAKPIKRRKTCDAIFWNDLINVGSPDFIGIPFSERRKLDDKKKVFDLSIADNHNFLASSVVVHNCVEYALAIQWEETKNKPNIKDGIPVDGDNPTHITWLYDRALERAQKFNIRGVTYRFTQGVVKKIIPAIASTNAIIASAETLEALKLATLMYNPMDDYMFYNGNEGIFSYTYKNERLEDCPSCCTIVPAPLSVDPTETLGDLIKRIPEVKVVKHHIGKPLGNSVSISEGGKQHYNSMISALENATKGNLLKTLPELGIETGDELLFASEGWPKHYPFVVDFGDAEEE